MSMSIPVVPFKSNLPRINGIEVIELDSIYDNAESLNHNPALAHKVGFHCLIYINKGQGNHFIDFCRYSVEPGTFIFINKHQVHAFDFNNFPKGYNILFTDEFLEGIQTRIKIPTLMPNNLSYLYQPSTVVEKTLKNSCESILQEIIVEQENTDSDQMVIQLLFSALLIKVINQLPKSLNNKMSEKRSQLFHKFLTLITSETNTSREASDYAKRLNITYKSLNEICKLATHKTAKQLIDAEIILSAKRKLAVEDIQIQSLAYQLGFEEVSNFVKYFKKHTTQTPSQFRKTLKS